MYYFALFVFSTYSTSLFRVFYSYLVTGVLQRLAWVPDVVHLVILYFSLGLPTLTNLRTGKPECIPHL